MKTIKFNYPPNVAIRYVEGWRKKMDSDPDADVRMKMIMQDICKLCHIAIANMEPDDNPIKKS